jgi:MFS family permease
VFGWLLVGAFLLVAFILYSLRRAGSALVDVRLFAHGPLASGSALTLAVRSSALRRHGATAPLFPGRARSGALRSGLPVASLGIGALLSRPIAGELTDRIGAKWVAFTGFLITGVALAVSLVLPGRHTAPNSRSNRN